MAKTRTRDKLALISGAWLIFFGAVIVLGFASLLVVLAPLALTFEILFED